MATTSTTTTSTTTRTPTTTTTRARTTAMTPDRAARLAALAARRAGAATSPHAPAQPPVPRDVLHKARRAPALASRVLVAGLSAASMLSIVAFIGAGSAGAAADTAQPTAVIHRIVGGAGPPPPAPDPVFQAVPAGREVT